LFNNIIICFGLALCHTENFCREAKLEGRSLSPKEAAQDKRPIKIANPKKKKKKKKKKIIICLKCLFGDASSFAVFSLSFFAPQRSLREKGTSSGSFAHCY
jgi:hypothetical protein